MREGTSIVDSTLVQQALTRYENGEEIREVCKDYGVSNVTLYKQIIATEEETWKALQVARALARKEDAEEELDSAAEMFSIARARERLKAAQWDLERVCRRIYGQEPAQVLGSGVIHITIGIQRDEKPAIEGEKG